MTRDLLIGARVEGTEVVITERLRGQPSRGLYRAAIAGADDGVTYLVTTTNRQSQPLDRVRAHLGFTLAGAAPFRAVGALEGGEDSYHALVEEEPMGRPSDLVGSPLPRAQAIQLARDVSEVLGRAHEAERVLAHLRPELIYATDDRRLSGVVPRPELFVLGASPHSSGIGPLFDDIYSAPEVVALARDVTPAADVFSLCACLGRWLSGEHPFGGDTVQAQMMAIMSGQRRPWRGPEDLGRVMSYGLDRDPQKRVSLDDLVELLRRAAEAPVSKPIVIPNTIGSRRVPYEDDYGTCGNTFAVLVVRSQSVDVRRIGEMLGLEATEATSDGHWQSPVDLHHVGGLQRWALTSAGQVSSRDLRRHLDWLLDRLEPARDALARLREMDGVDVEILCPWMSAHGQGGPTLWPEQMARLGELGLACHFSVGFAGAK